MTIPFRKMHGLGNDFIVFDARKRPIIFEGSAVTRLADRHTGIGADTIVVIENPPDSSVDLFVRFHNADGMQVGTCGNGYPMCRKTVFSPRRGAITSGLGPLMVCSQAWPDGDNIAVDMGTPKLDWRQIPVAWVADTLHLPQTGKLSDAVGVNMGNPHAVFFVDDVGAVDVAAQGQGGRG